MSEDTPATSTDPALGSEGDSNQIPGEDSMSGEDVDDLLDQGYSPPERPRPNHYGETPWEESHGEPMDLKLAQEEPEVWEAPEKGRTEPDRAGRLTADTDSTQGKDNDVFAEDVGIDGAAASAEEAAVHVIDEP
ncbi:DUF5709 domain-containing protein [Sanguibacter suaedae]|uniref:DUF5709 domain-containing protein n=1 Tax=Sanguibacter suaedae TaxID=2795737 RepID=A0A934IBZ3_9MICO|nr:DUF5709 domain-containing protein [Sanguibacter suaedae]MBI9114069.1 hypothetical protein [Sanguibacter suaedae]